MADIPDLGHFAFPCGESQFRAQMQNILNWMEDLQTTSIPIGGVLMWAKPLADAPAGFVMADGTANSVALGGTGKDLRGFIKVSADPPGTEVAAVRTGDTTSEGTNTARTAGTPAADTITSNNVTLTAGGTTGSTSTGTVTGTTDVDPVTRHGHDHNHSLSGWTTYQIPETVSGAYTNIEAKNPAGSIAVSNDETPGSSHAHAFSGSSFGAHTHTFSDTDVGLVSSDEHNHTIAFTGAEMNTHTHPLVMDEHDHTPGAPAATTVILLERIF